MSNEKVGILKTTYTLYAEEGYLSHYNEDTYLFQDAQCNSTTFEDISDARALWHKLSNSVEFSWTTIHVIQIDRHLVRGCLNEVT